MPLCIIPGLSNVIKIRVYCYFLFEELFAISVIANIWKNTSLDGQFLIPCLPQTQTHTHACILWCPPLILGPVTGWKARVMDGQGLITFNQLRPWIMMNSPFYTHRMQRERDALGRDVCRVLFVEFINSGRCRSSSIAFIPYIHIANAADALRSTAFFRSARAASSTYLYHSAT